MDAHIDEKYSQSTHGLLQFLSWTAPIVFVFSLIYGALYIALQDINIGLIGLIIFLFSCITWVSRYNLQKNNTAQAIALFSAGQLIAAICVVIIQPHLLPALILVPLLSIAAALPYIKGEFIKLLTIASWIILIIITASGLILGDPASTAVYDKYLLFGLIAATSGLIMLLLWQFSNRLNNALDTMYAARKELANSNQALADNNAQLAEKINEQEKLLQLVATLEVPVIQLSNGILLAPLVGHIDSRRATLLTNRLLQRANQQHAAMVIIDITGIPLMDTMVAQLIVELTQALRLLGCKIALCGISAEVAITLTNLGISLKDIMTVRGPQEAIDMYQRSKAESNSASYLMVGRN